MKIVARNRSVTHNYFLEEKFEAGLKLLGSEIKSIRAGKVSINEAYITFKGNEAYVTNMHIAKFDQASYNNHDETRARKLLLHKRQIISLAVQSKEQGYAVVPVRLYLKHGLAKLEIALARGKKHYDKREDLKRRDMERRVQKIRERY